MNRGNYLKDRRLVLAEGFHLSGLLSLCLRQGIRLRRIRQRNGITMTFEVPEDVWPDLVKLAGSRWRLTTLERRGAKPLISRILGRKSFLVGLGLFLFLVSFQSLFIHEIRIEGFQRLTETEIREALADAGLYEGCRKSLDPEGVAIQMYQVLDDIAYCGIRYEGGLARVYISERTPVPEPLDPSGFCHVTAKKAGYIERVIAAGGSPAVIRGQYVEPGDILISGAFQIPDTTYESTGEGKVTYTHARGEVLARVPYRITLYQDLYVPDHSLTGRQAPGILIAFGDRVFRSDSLFRPYDAAISYEHPILSVTRPFPFRLSGLFSCEISSEKEERSPEEASRIAEAQLRTWCRKNLPENAEILNKDLKFTPRNNIIEVTIMLEVLEDIGRMQPFVPARILPPPEGEDSIR